MASFILRRDGGTLSSSARAATLSFRIGAMSVGEVGEKF